MVSGWKWAKGFRLSSRSDHPTAVPSKVDYSLRHIVLDRVSESHVRKFSKPNIIRSLCILIVLFLGGGMWGCSSSARYVEQYEVKNLKVVFLDQQSLHDEWEKRTGQQGVRFLPRMSTGLPAIKTLKGFYDFSTDTLYCPKWNFEICGHELHHAVLGHFHPHK